MHVMKRPLGRRNRIIVSGLLVLSLLLCAYSIRQLFVINVPTREIKDFEIVYSLAFSPDGKIVVAGCGDGTLGVFEMPEGNRLSVWKGHTSDVSKIVFFADKSSFASASWDHTIKLWDRNTCQNQQSFAHDTRVMDICACPDHYLASFDWDGLTKIWNLQSGRSVFSKSWNDETVWSVDIHPNGRLIAIVGDSPYIAFFDLHARHVIGLVAGHSSPLRTVCFSPDGKLLFTGGTDRTVKIWDLAPICRKLQKENDLIGEKKAEIWEPARTTIYHAATVTCVRVSPNGHYFASVSTDKSIRVWRLKDRKEVFILRHNQRVRCAAFSPTHNILVSGTGFRSFVLWDLETGKRVRSVQVK